MKTGKVSPATESPDGAVRESQSPDAPTTSGGAGAQGSNVDANNRLSPDSMIGAEDVPINPSEIKERNYSPDSMGEPVPTPILTSVRFRLAIVCWFGFAVLYAQRTNLSIAMVCMVKTMHSNESDAHAEEDALCPQLENEENLSGFDWNKALQGQILGSFFYGYLILQLPGGMLSERFGAKHVVSIGMVPVAILTLLTPMLTKIHYIVLLTIRVIIGLGEAVMYPAATALWGKWSPPLERSMLIGISLSGGQFGNAVALPVGGLLCANVNWESVFYVIGGFGALFCIIWMAWVNATPAQHKGLSEKERVYLERCVPHVSETAPKHGTGTPWKAIFTSRPFWAILIAHTTGNYTYYMNMTQMPTYMKEVLKFDIESNGAFSMLPYLVFWLSAMGSGVLSDLIVHKKVPVVVVRKIFAFIGLVGPAGFMVLTAYIDCTKKYVAVFTLCCAVGFTGFGFASYLVNHGDLAPEYAGTLFGISNTLATLPGFVAPIIVGEITPDGTVEQWRVAFYIAAGINIVGAAVYVLMSSAKIQPWSASVVDSKREHKTEEQLELERIKARAESPTSKEMKARLRKFDTLRRMSTMLKA